MGLAETMKSTQERNISMGRRGENIRKRKDGRWEARIICSYDAAGKARYHSLYGKTYAEVKQKRKDFTEKLTENSSECQTDAKVTVKQVLCEWLVSRKDSVKQSTYANYANLLRKHINPALGDYEISSLTSDIVNRFLREKLNSGRLDGTGGLSPKTVTDIRSVLLLGIEYGREQKYPCAIDKTIFCPRNQQPQMRILTPAEQSRLEEVIFQNPQPMELGVILALYSGLRIGEVCALRWADINLESGTVDVSKTIMRIMDPSPAAEKKTHIVIDRPKTETSIRSIPLQGFLVSLLRKYQKERECFLITGNRRYLEPRIFLNKYKKLLKKAAVTSVTFYTLRHTFATRCAENGFDPKALSEILGHANVNTMLQRYVHPSMEAKREQMERLAKMSEKGQSYGHSLNNA